jgi:hypothetical protein
MLEAILHVLLDVALLHFFDDLSLTDGWRTFLKFVVYLLFFLGLIALVYYLFIRP